HPRWAPPRRSRPAPELAGGHAVPPEPVPEEPAHRAGVGVPVVGDVAHVVVDVVAVEDTVGHLGQPPRHVVAVLVGDVGAVPAPHHHGRRADLAVGDPAHVVLVIPGGDALGPAEGAAVDSVSGSHDGQAYRRVVDRRPASVRSSAWLPDPPAPATSPSPTPATGRGSWCCTRGGG